MCASAGSIAYLGRTTAAASPRITQGSLPSVSPCCQQASTAAWRRYAWYTRFRCPCKGPGLACHVAVRGDNDADEDDSPATATKPYRVERLLSNLGYGTRKECAALVKRGDVTTVDGGRLKVGDKVRHADLLLEGEELDPAFPLTLVLHKPTGYVVTSPDDEKVSDPVVYDLLPYRFGRRKPFLSCVGRLDKDTSGLLVLTDDGQLVQRINSPKRGIWKEYHAVLDRPLIGKDADAAARKFASGRMLLVGDRQPLLPAKLVMLEDDVAKVLLCEGRYHQVRRMFKHIGYEVVALHRKSVGGLTADGLGAGQWRLAAEEDMQALFNGPDVSTSDDESTPADSHNGTAASSAAAAPQSLPGTSSRSTIQSLERGDHDRHVDDDADANVGFYEYMDEAEDNSSTSRSEDESSAQKRARAQKRRQRLRMQLKRSVASLN